MIRLSLDAECGSFGRTVAPGRPAITDEIEPPVFVPVCSGCGSGLDGVAAATTLRGTEPRRDSKAPRSGMCPPISSI